MSLSLLQSASPEERLKREWLTRFQQFQAAARQSPRDFRSLLRIDPDHNATLASRELGWQTRDFGALDSAWTRLAYGTAVHPPTIRRAYLERPRGHSKTTDTAVQLAWLLFAARRPINGLVAAADLEQAQLVHRALKRLAQVNAPLLDDLRFVENAVRNSASGSLLKIVSSDVRSSWGELPDFVICDELCHWKLPELWYSLLSSAAKKPESVLVVLSNAGFGRGWQWEAREAARLDPAWYFSTLAGPQAPWITSDSLDEQRRLLPPAVFARLWLNQWQHSDGGFVSLAEAEVCRDESLSPVEQGDPTISYVATIDYAEKHDLTVGCVCHLDAGRVIVDRMDVVRPRPDRPTPVKWVSDWMHAIAAAFPQVRFVLDAHQLLSIIQGLSQKFAIERYEFQAGQANHDMALTLRQLVLERTIRWYPGCGRIPGEEADDDRLETELASLIVKERPGGRLRFDHIADGRHHDDRAFALGAACQALLKSPPAEPDWIHMTSPEDGGLL